MKYRAEECIAWKGIDPRPARAAHPAQVQQVNPLIQTTGTLSVVMSRLSGMPTRRIKPEKQCTCRSWVWNRWPWKIPRTAPIPPVHH